MKMNRRIYRPKYPEIIDDKFYDHIMDCDINRLTDSQIIADGEPIKAGSILGSYFGNSEPYMSNCDETILACQKSILKNDQWIQRVQLYDRELNIIGELPVGIGIMNIRWSNLEPNMLFVFREGNIEKYNVSKICYNNKNLIYKIEYRAFLSLTLSMAGMEGNISNNNQVILNTVTRLIHYDLKRMKIISLSPDGLFDIGKIGNSKRKQTIDYATISPNGDWILICWANGVKDHSGIEVYDTDWNFFRRIYPNEIHWCVGIDSRNKQVIYTTLPFDQKFIQENAISDDCKSGDFVKIDIETGQIIKLLDVPKWTHFTVAKARDRSDIVYISFFERDLGKNIYGQQKWSPFFGEIVEVQTNGSGEFHRICHTYAKPIVGIDKPTKWWQPDHQVFNGKVLWRSCMNQPSGIGDIFWTNI